MRLVATEDRINGKSKHHAIGSSQYYPYAYVSAPEPYCEGLTEDGCELMWQEVETIEGDVINQCVAYCPWQ